MKLVAFPLAAALVLSATASQAVVFTYTGAPAEWMAPETGYYRITAMGAQGGGRPPSPFTPELSTGGLGAEVSGRFLFEGGTSLLIVVGRAGYYPYAGGGGGASWILLTDSNWTPVAVAGGGGGAGYFGDPGGPGEASFTGGTGTGGGVGGGGGGGGAGWRRDGEDGDTYVDELEGPVRAQGGRWGGDTPDLTGGLALDEPCLGSSPEETCGWFSGGYGGGGAGGWGGGGGGGGYEGGNGGAINEEFHFYGPGAGGSSYLDTPHPYFQRSGVQVGNGLVTIDREPDPIPEPATWSMLLLGFAALGAALRSCRQGQGSRRPARG